MNPYDRRVWDYSISVAEEAAKAGFDEIMLDYVRFPSDGDVAGAVYPGKTSVPRGRMLADFVAYAKRRLQPLGVRVSTALFGLSATRDMGLGQVPRWISQHVDNVSPMAYPSLYSNGELGVADPYREPGETVFRTLADFRKQLQRTPGAADPVAAGLLRLRSRSGPGADRRRPPPGRQGLPPLERRRAATRSRRSPAGAEP